jgi:hypothetical protein
MTVSDVSVARGCFFSVFAATTWPIHHRNILNTLAY